MASKPRARRNRDEGQESVKKEELDKQNDIWGLDEQNKINRIKPQHENIFETHQLQQNMLQQGFNSKNSHKSFINFEDEDTKREANRTEKQVENVKKDVEAHRIRKKQRGKSEINKLYFQEQETIEQNEQLLQIPSQSVFQPEQLEDEEIQIPTSQISKVEQGKKRQHLQSQEVEAKIQEQRMKQLLTKKSTSTLDNYIHMHFLINNSRLNKQERKIAIYTPLQPNQHSYVYLKRYQNGFSQYFQVIGEDQRAILFCQNQRGCIGCNYYISLTREMDKNSSAYLGKLRGNATGSIYQLYDNGIAPNKQYNRSKFRVNMAYIEYQNNFFGMKGPRKLRVIVPKVKGYGDLDMYKFSQQESFNDSGVRDIIRLRNKQPKWNQRLGSYALNFGGRVTQASIKNFILVDQKYSLEEQQKAPNSIIFGKIGQNTFALQFSYPLSLFQALGIAISEFDFKLKCQ